MECYRILSPWPSWAREVDGWEKQGIPVSRLSSLDCALNIVEELNRLEEASDKEATGMPTSGAMGDPWDEV